MLEIIEKGQKFDLNVMSKRTNPEKFYFGAGWGTKDGAAVDLDIVAVICRGGVLTQASDFIYFGNRGVGTAVELSEDNTTGEGDGDDEDIVINTAALDADVDKVVVGLVAYAGADLSCAPDLHFRVCDGDNEKSEQIGDVNLGDSAIPKDTAVVAFTLTRQEDGSFSLENNSELLQLGAGKAAITAFGARFQA